MPLVATANDLICTLESKDLGRFSGGHVVFLYVDVHLHRIWPKCENGRIAHDVPGPLRRARRHPGYSEWRFAGTANHTVGLHLIEHRCWNAPVGREADHSRQDPPVEQEPKRFVELERAASSRFVNAGARWRREGCDRKATAPHVVVVTAFAANREHDDDERWKGPLREGHEETLATRTVNANVADLMLKSTTMVFSRAWLIVVVAAAACAGNGSFGGGTVTSPNPPATTAPTSTTADYRRLEQEVFAELNAARTNPQAYAANVSALLPLFDGNVLVMPGGVRIRTSEGAAAVREAVDALNRQPKVSRVSLATGLSSAARDLVVDQTRTGSVGHQASDGASPDVRIRRYGTWQKTYSENIAYGTFSSGRDVVVNLIVDDGVANRGHRRNIFDQNVAVIGVACGRHPRFGASCVIDQAGGFVPK